MAGCARNCSRRDVGIAFAILAASCLASLESGRADGVYDPELVKAGVVAQITRFVEWPAAASGPHPRIVEVVFVGTSRVADALRAMPGGAFRVRVVQRASEIGSAHVVFVPRAADGSLSETLRTLAGRPVLVIADGPSAALRGAAFGLRDDGRRVRIEVNRDALERAHLRVSYHVLRLSTEVRP